MKQSSIGRLKPKAMSKRKTSFNSRSWMLNVKTNFLNWR